MIDCEKHGVKATDTTGICPDCSSVEFQIYCDNCSKTDISYKKGKWFLCNQCRQNIESWKQIGEGFEKLYPQNPQ